MSSFDPKPSPRRPIFTAYLVLCRAICVLIAVQASAHAWLSAGLSRWIAGGGVLDQSTATGPNPFPETAGFVVHAVNGLAVIPTLALALLIVGLFSRSRPALIRAGLVVLLVAAQVTFGLLGHGQPLFGMLHGLNALALFAVAFANSRLARDSFETAAPEVVTVAA